ncbi:calcium-binding protein [Phormidium sp. CLA17]|uniref:calcium-binding protein n=1 Tax=Leptolyngbya sp. Cla-17 TaxID=2803751 RepID=UPI00149123E7|nr:calcium-binding protein [Leptolyngbya sp. Cla-17]MBM0744149.1 calcium-binding protein [Leptolyngbya sp. Cla-17]
MNITTGNGNDRIIQLMNVIFSDDVIRTNGGNDTINPGLGRDYVYGGDGLDHLILDYSVGDTGGGVDFNAGTSAWRRTSDRVDSILFSEIEQFTVTGTSKDDTFYNLTTQNSVIRAGAGNDQVSIPRPIAGNLGFFDGGTGIDTLTLDLSNQTANLNLSNLLDINVSGVIRATNFERFSLITGSGNDTVLQTGIVNGAVFRANDYIQTGAGNDTVNAGLGSDTVFGGAGLDHLIVDYSIGDTGTGMRFNGSSLYGTALRNVSSTNATVLDFVTFTGIERFTVTGTSKDDTIFTSSGNDIINAGAGNDLISGGGGGDILTGGLGVDTFQYQSYSDSLLANFDRIKDFAIGVDAIDGPRAVAAAQIKKLGYVSNLTETAIQQTLTPNNFVVNGASTFKFRDGLSDRTFLALNDSRAGFSASADSIIEITGFTGNLNSLSIV